MSSADDTAPEVEAHGNYLNVNETVVEDEPEVEAHGQYLNVNEAVVEDEPEVEVHGTQINVNEAVVEDAGGAPEGAADPDSEHEPGRRIRRS